MKQFLIFRCSKSDGGSTCSGIHTQQGDGSDLVVQGLKALGLAVLGGELQNVGHVGLLVGLHVAGDDDVLAVSQTVLAGQIVTLLVAAYSSVTVEPVVLYTVYSAVVGSAASLEAASELAASEEAAAEEATEEEAAVEDAEEPQAVMPTASAAAAATIAMFLSFM